jgi:hypothetical protein
VDNELSKFSGLFGDFSNASSSILSNLNIHIFKTVQNSWENFSLNNNFSKINGMLGNLSKTLTDISLKLSIWMRNKSGKVWDSSLINNSLG